MNTKLNELLELEDFKNSKIFDMNKSESCQKLMNLSEPISKIIVIADNILFYDHIILQVQNICTHKFAVLLSTEYLDNKDFYNTIFKNNQSYGLKNIFYYLDGNSLFWGIWKKGYRGQPLVNWIN